MASLVLTGISFLSSHKMPLPVSATLSGVLLVTKFVTERKAAPSPVREIASSPAEQLPPELLRRMTLG
jgi:hypothetical protein